MPTYIVQDSRCAQYQTSQRVHVTSLLYVGKAAVGAWTGPVSAYLVAVLARKGCTCEERATSQVNAQVAPRVSLGIPSSRRTLLDDVLISLGWPPLPMATQLGRLSFAGNKPGNCHRLEA